MEIYEKLSRWLQRLGRDRVIYTRDRVIYKRRQRRRVGVGKKDMVFILSLML